MSNDTTTKVCSQCKIEKELSEFHKRKKSRIGVCSRCKVCRSNNKKQNKILKVNPYDANAISKKCRECLIDKPLADFTKNKRNKDGFDKRCKICKSNYYYENREHLLEIGAQNREKTKEKRNNNAKIYYQNNKEQMLEYGRQYRCENKETVSLWGSEWRQKNPEKVKTYYHNRRARKYNAEGFYTEQEIIEQFISQLGYCFWCDKPLADPFAIGGCNKQTHLDHIIPLFKGGSNWISNLCWTCQHCNNSKRDKLPSEWSGNDGRWVE